MKRSNRIVVVLVCLIMSGSLALYQAQTVPDLVGATETLLASLDADQADKLMFEFGDEERFQWAFIPGEMSPRMGLSLEEMTPEQQALAHSVLAAALGYRGFMKATTVMSLEQVLHEIEGPEGRFNRHPELYYFTIYGEPSTSGTWALRVDGHHVAVNVTMADGKFASAAPTFLGSNPAEVKDGPRAGLRVLGREEDLARELFLSLDLDQTSRALIQTEAPRDIITGTDREASIEGGPSGLPASAMTDGQKNLLRQLILEYTNRTLPVVEAEVMSRIEEAGFDNVHFAWAGGAERGEGHYYRVHGPTILIEYDNTQNDGNHVHSVFRDLENDFGGDSLRAHYEAFPHSSAVAD